MSCLEEEYKQHVVLLGDSIFDNARYVKQGYPAVIDQLKKKGKALNWKTTNCAVDGARSIDVINDYINRIPLDSTIIVLSIGGNDGLKSLGKIAYGVSSIWFPWNLYNLFMETKEEFNKKYIEILKKIKIKCPNTKIIVCTIYYAMFPTSTSVLIQLIANIGVNILSKVIIESALKYGNIPVIDLRFVFDKKEDYANSIEPNVAGGDKIINNVINIVNNHDFNKIYKKEKDIIYKQVKYSNDMNPFDFTNKYWKMTDIDQQKGSQTTIFFRKAFDERENANIKFYTKWAILTAISIGTACIVWKLKYRYPNKLW